jgi:O-antigen ligase
MKLLRIAVCLLLAFAVLAHGGVEDWARAVLETGAGFLFFVWALRAYFHKEESIVVPSVFPPLFAFCVLVFLQWLLRASSSSFATRTELQLLFADVLLIFVAAQAFRTVEHWRFFIWFLMIFAFLVSGFGILQHLTFNGKLYWFREMRYGGIPFGPYVNRNHFAGFAELVIPMSLVPLALGKVRRDRLIIVVILAVIPLAALFLSASRGGIISVLTEFVLFTVLLVVRRSVGKPVLAGAAVLVLAFSLVSWLGVREILSRFASLQNLEVSEKKRASMRQGTWHIFRDHPLFGTGLGTLQIVYPAYETLYDGKIVNHTHNDYLEALAETGILGGLCCAWFLGVLFLTSFQRIQRPSSVFAGVLHLAAITGCCGFLVHSLVDFNLHIPANALLFLLLASVATAEIQPSSPPAGSLRASS